MSPDFSFHFDASVEALIDKLLQSGIVPTDILEPIILDNIIISSNEDISNKTNPDKEKSRTLLAFLKQEHEEIIRSNLFISTERGKSHFLQKAWEYFHLKEYATGIIINKAILMIDPKYAPSYFYEARLVWLLEGIPAYLKKENFYYQKTRHDPFSLSRMYNLSGCIMDVLERYDEALMYFRNANATLPSEVIYVANAAEMHYKLKEPQMALKCAQMAKKRGSTAPIILEIIANEGYLFD